MPPVHTPPSASTATAAELARALRELEPRTGALLRHRLLEGRTSEACAALYGSSPEAFEVHLLRACLALEARLGGAPHETPRDAHEERAWAAQLSLGLQRQAGGPGVAAAVRLEQLSGQVLAELAAAEQREAQSPRRRRDEWLRRLVVVLLLALTAWYILVRPASEAPPAPATRPR